MRLNGKVALVSGGGTGIGAATARRFAAEGAKVVVTGRRPEPIEAVAAEIGGRAVAGDTVDDAHVRAAVEAAREAFGGLDVVVASAGVGFFGTVGDVDDQKWQLTLDVNVTGAFRLVRAALPSLIERGGGSIVLVSSTAAFVSGSENAAYATSKAAMNGLARSLAVDYGPLGIRANALCPGWVVTPRATIRWNHSSRNGASRRKMPTVTSPSTRRSNGPRQPRKSLRAASSLPATSRRSSRVQP